MTALLVYSITLVLAVLLSGIAARTVLSTTVLFLAAGFVAGAGALYILPVQPNDPLESTLAELALFSVLFTDGMRVSLPSLASAWRLPGRALLLGLPLTLALIAVFAYLLAGLNWVQSFLLGAVLSPTDPVFAAAIVGRQEVPRRLRQLLNVESGLNDGLALPVVLVLVAVAGEMAVSALVVSAQVALGVVAGVVIPWVVLRLERIAILTAINIYEPLNAFAIGILVLSATATANVNEFLAAFSAGITVATVSIAARDAFHQFGELVTELLKLAAVLLFGALIAPSTFASVPAGGYIFMVLVLFVARPVALLIALFGSQLTRREKLTAAWFGPKGFASVLYGLIVLKSGIPDAQYLFNLAAIVIVVSIVLHSSTDVIIVRWFRDGDAGENQE